MNDYIQVAIVICMVCAFVTFVINCERKSSKANKELNDAMDKLMIALDEKVADGEAVYQAYKKMRGES